MTSERLLARLTQATTMSQPELLELLDKAQNSQLPLDLALVSTGLSEERIYQILADLYGIALVKADPDPEVARLIPESLARNHAVLPLSRDGNRLVLAMADPVDVLGEDAVRQATGYEITRVLAPRSAILAAITDIHHGPGGIHSLLEQMPDAEGLDEAADSGEEQADLYQTRPIIQLVNTILTDAVKGGRRPCECAFASTGSCGP